LAPKFGKFPSFEIGGKFENFQRKKMGVNECRRELCDTFGRKAADLGKMNTVWKVRSEDQVI